MAIQYGSKNVSTACLTETSLKYKLAVLLVVNIQSTVEALLLLTNAESDSSKQTLARVEKAQQKSEELISRLIKENGELKAMFVNKAQDSGHYGFPGSDEELHGLRRTIIDCEESVLAGQGWDLGESLMKGKTNQLHVKAITNMFLVHEDLQNMLRRHRWMESNIKKYVQSVLHNRLKYLKQADKDAKKGDLKRHASLIARMLATVTTRLATFRKHKAIFTSDSMTNGETRAAYGTEAECSAVLVSEMMSDQEEELDAENKPVPFRLAPTYRSVKCETFLDELDDLRYADNRKRNGRFIATYVGHRRYVERRGVQSKKFQSMPSWSLDTENL
ncbi:hypothetical protein BD560DRAFT_464305 [Blakeslea trispora]|nr:hypothetical protein BD560DRAFT_464305 [Blakeslea trispora]